MEHEAQPPGTAGGLGRAEVDADQTPSLDLDAALFARLAPTGLPGRLTVGLQLPAGNGPMALVGGVEHEQPSALVEEQRTGGGGYARRLA